MTTKAKEIKVSTLQGRFNKLHDAVNYAEDCSKAIAFHADRLAEGDCPDPQTKAISVLDDAIGEWCEHFVALASEMQKVESQYMDYLSDDHQRCRLIEDVPAYAKGEIPDTFQMSEKLFKIGYYEMEEDLYGVKNHRFTPQEILSDMQDLHLYLSLCLKAMDHAEYKGIWSEVGKKVHDIFDSVPDEPFYKLLATFGIKPGQIG